MPSAQYDRFVGIELLGGAGNLHRFLDHWTGDQGDGQAESIFEFFQHPLLEVGRYCGIDDLDLISGTQQGGGDSQYPQRRRCFLTGEGWEEKDDFLRAHYSVTG